MNSGKEKKDSPASAPPERIARGLLGVAAMTERVARPILGKRGFTEGQVLGRWPEIIGPELAATTAPEKVRFERDRQAGGTLYLRVASGAAATLIHPQIPQIIERVNSYLGSRAIDSIKVSQGPLPTLKRRKPLPPTKPLAKEELLAVESDIGHLESDSVKSALARLGARLKKRS